MSYLRSHAKALDARRRAVQQDRRSYPRARRRGAQGRPLGGSGDRGGPDQPVPRPADPAQNLAMTGEVTLTGRVLPVGGVSEKILAARRAGIQTVLIPRHNEKDLVELPAEVKADLTFGLIDTLDDVVTRLFESRGDRPRRNPDPLKTKPPLEAGKSSKIKHQTDRETDAPASSRVDLPPSEASFGRQPGLSQPLNRNARFPARSLPREGQRDLQAIRRGAGP